MIFIGLGSNEGEPQKYVQRALDLLPEFGIELVRCSSFYHTAPWGIKEQAYFVNAVAEVAFDGPAIDLLDQLLAIEEHMGRTRHFKWGPRLIDLDILEYNRLEIETERLQVPHPFYPHRDFVLVPLAELEPDWIPTGFEQDIQRLIEDLGPTEIRPLMPSK